jgi:hypothetical protein
MKWYIWSPKVTHNAGSLYTSTPTQEGNTTIQPDVYRTNPLMSISWTNTAFIGLTIPFEYKKKDLPCADIIAFFTSLSLCIYPGLWLTITKKLQAALTFFFCFFFFFIQHFQQVTTHNSVQFGLTIPFEYKKKDLPCADIIAFFTSFIDVQDIAWQTSPYS